MTVREMLEKREREFLSPYAALSAESKGREREITPCDLRTDFQRDRDKIIYTKAFRRLKHKTQVFIAPLGDHYRTRLTHTLEVGQIARSISRALCLNEDLTEAIAMGHDLGHTPFGHAGERALAELSKKPLIASHSNFRTLCPHSRNLTDSMGRFIVEHDGMIGLNMYPEFIGVEKDQQTVDGFFDHLDYCIDKFGSDNIGFGGDVDGTSGMYPSPITEDRSIHDQFVDAMIIRGYSDDIIEKFTSQNYLNFLKKYL